MISSDLKYIFNNSPYKEKNIYNQKLITATLSLHTNFLKNSIINYKTTLPKGKTKRVIHVNRADGSEIAIVNGVSYPTNAQIGKWLVNDKFKTEKHLQIFNINTPNSKIYNQKDVAQAKLETFIDSKSPVVIKPLISTMSKGVMLNVTEDRFYNAWENCLDTMTNSNGKILVQNYLEGFEARATIVHGKLVAIMLRIPPYVIGNGKDSVESLIDKKNIERARCGYMKRLPIQKNNIIHEFLMSQGLDLNYTPSDNEYVLLSSISNVSGGGGELMNITNIVSPNIRETALDALASIPGLFTGGVDIMMRSFDDEQPIILEINSFPGLSNATYPTYGNSSNPSKVYYESLVVLDQFRNRQNINYNIEGEKEYLSNYLSFLNRKQNLLSINYRSLRQNLL